MLSKYKHEGCFSTALAKAYLAWRFLFESKHFSDAALKFTQTNWTASILISAAKNDPLILLMIHFFSRTSSQLNQILQRIKIFTFSSSFSFTRWPQLQLSEDSSRNDEHWSSALVGWWRWWCLLRSLSDAVIVMQLRSLVAISSMQQTQLLSRTKAFGGDCSLGSRALVEVFSCDRLLD